MNDSKDQKAAAEPPLDCRVGRDIVPLAMAIRCRNKNYQGQWTPWLLCSLRLWQGEEAAQRALEDWPADEKELVRLYDMTPNAK